jgi:hypothetical protein
VSQLPGERNYHVFYQWTKAGQADEKQMYGIQGPSQFEYCVRGQCIDVAGMDDFKEYADMRQAMNVIGITANEQVRASKLERSQRGNSRSLLLLCREKSLHCWLLYCGLAIVRCVKSMAMQRYIYIFSFKKIVVGENECLFVNPMLLGV